MSWEAVKQARQRLDREKGTICKDWGGKLHIALVYPNSYYLGMSSLGFQTIYRILNESPRLVCERVFLDPVDSALEEPLSLESQRPLSDFDVIAFSISYELDYFNVVRLLKNAGIPLYTTEREENHPLIIAGGPCVTANPVPLSPLFDCFAIGEGEAILPGFIEILGGGMEESREDLLSKLASLPGIFAPALAGGRVRREWLSDLQSTSTTSVILTPDTDLSSTYLVEIARGCGWGCRFCLAGFHFRPFRFRSLQRIQAEIEEGLKRTNRIGLLAAAVSDHPDIEEILKYLRKREAEVSVSSLRISYRTETILKPLSESGAHTVSLAPEAGSQRLRSVINKRVTEDGIFRTVKAAADSGFRNIKLYFMIGLPGETDDDIQETVSLVRKLRKAVEKKGAHLTLSVETFVPKAGTPFQWLPMPGEDVLSGRMNSIKTGLTRSGVEVRSESVSWSIVQGVLARGDARLAGALVSMTRNSLAAWRKALRDCGLDQSYYVHRSISLDETLPWSMIESGSGRQYLQAEFEEASRICETRFCADG